MTSKSPTPHDVVLSELQRTLSGEQGVFSIIRDDVSGGCFVITQRRKYAILLLRGIIKDRDKVFLYTEKDLPCMMLFRQENFVDSPDFFLAIGKGFIPIWSSLHPDVELDLTAFAVGEGNTSRMLGLRAYFSSMPVGIERKKEDGFVALTRDPRVIADWSQRIQPLNHDVFESGIELEMPANNQTEGCVTSSESEEKGPKV